MPQITFSSEIKQDALIHTKDLTTLVEYLTSSFRPWSSCDKILIDVYTKTNDAIIKTMTSIEFKFSTIENNESTQYVYKCYRAKDFACSNIQHSKI